MRLHVGRFLVGSFAGLCAVFGPRLISLLATSDPTKEITLFDWSYLTIGVVVSIMIGAGIVVTKWNIAAAAATPNQIFGAALAFPALIAGGLNMSASVGQLSATQQELLDVNRAALVRTGLPTRQSDSIRILGSVNSNSLESQGLRNGFSLIGSAHAQDGQQEKFLTATPGGFNPARIVSQQQYFIFLDEFDSAEDAMEATDALRAIAPGAVAVESGGRFYVLEDTNTQPLSKATLEALRLFDEIPGTYVGNATPGLIQAPSR